MSDLPLLDIPPDIGEVFNKKYYYISYWFKHHKHGSISRHEELIEIHPVQWLVEARDKHDDGRFDLTFWKEVPQQIYLKYKDDLG